ICAATDQHQRRKAETRAHKIEIQLPEGKIDKSSAVGVASVFVRKLNPSGLPAEEPAAAQQFRYAGVKLPNATSPALQYGLWWHYFAQRLSWNDKGEEWERFFDEQKKFSPDPARSAREWKLLVSHLSVSTGFRHAFSKDDFAHCEMPFLWKVDQSRCLEGVIDLAFFARK